MAMTLVPAAQADPIDRGRYNCYVFFAAGTPTYTGRYITIKSATRYSFYNGKANKAGKYRHGSRAGIKFRKGPLRRKPAKHKVYGDGTHGIELQMKRGSAGSYYCSHA